MLPNTSFHLLPLSASRVPIFQCATPPPKRPREAVAASSTQCFTTPPPPHRFQASLLNISFVAAGCVQPQPPAAACFDPADRDTLRYANHRIWKNRLFGH